MIVSRYRRFTVVLVFAGVLAWSTLLPAQHVKVINVTPHELSSETAQNAEPNIALNPVNPDQAIVSVFTNVFGGPGVLNPSPYFLTTNGGARWTQFDSHVHGDTTVAWSAGGLAYMTRLFNILFGATGPMQGSIEVRQSTPPAPYVAIANSLYTTPPNTSIPDQPWLEVANMGGVDRLYVGLNDVSRHTAHGDGRTASIHLSLDGGANWTMPPVVIERMAPFRQDLPPTRVAANGNRVYAVFMRPTANGSLNGNNFISQVVVVRDDNGGNPDAMGNRFQALGLIGPNGAQGVGVLAHPLEVPCNGGTTLGQQRLCSYLSIAVDPTNSESVFVAYTEVTTNSAGTVMPQLHVAFSFDGGVQWSTNRSLPLNTSLPALAVASNGMIGLLYTRLSGGNLETHFRQFSLAQLVSTFDTLSDDVLAVFPDGMPPFSSHPYIGDYQDLGAVSNVFYGTFSASNDPKAPQFPQGVFYQRNVLVGGVLNSNFVLTTDGVLANNAGAPMPGGVSIDPFFFVAPTALDFGDAPAPYPTLTYFNGARHFIRPGFHLGTQVDDEPDGQPHLKAILDDNNGRDDEDGVIFKTCLKPNELATLHVVASAPGKLDAWIDFDANGEWAQPGEQIFTNQVLVAGTNVLQFLVPPSAPSAHTYARFRFGSTGGLGPAGPAIDGEVEDYRVAIDLLDFGDAQDTMPNDPLGFYDYLTVLAKDGARHCIVPGFHLGFCIDGEPDGQPTPLADGDDQITATDLDDEDGVAFMNVPPMPGPNQVLVSASAPGFLDAWCDFNDNYKWDAGEQIFMSQPVTKGINVLTYLVPMPGPTPTPAFRFRFSSTGGLLPYGLAPDGEVEDYGRELPVADHGDAPAPYPTLNLQNGAAHILRPDFHLGGAVDPEPDGQPDPNALGDDLAMADDEDGVLFGPLVAGEMADVQVTATADGRLDAWMDFNADGDWEDPGERIFTNQVLVAGANMLNFRVPATALDTNTFARFRFSSIGGLSFVDLAPDGEVEDYAVEIKSQDFGDAPAPYPTLLAANGPRHKVVAGFHLGLLEDGEKDGQPNPTATGDDLAGVPNNDEDGVLLGLLTPGQVATARVTASAPGKLDGWIDFNADGDWNGLGENVFANVALAAGPNLLNVAVSLAATPGTAFARFRFSKAGGLPPTGEAPDGEVEDYRVQIEHPDFGDAPVSYRTLLPTGARHSVVPGFFLGLAVDKEPNGLPNAGATGDDLTAFADEDGVVFLTSLEPGQTASVRVTASAAGRLDAWIDFDINGTWGAGEQIFVSTPLLAGPNTLTFPVPATATLGSTYARFRFSNTGFLPFFGPASDGEVEDYQVTIGFSFGMDFGDAPAYYPTLLVHNGPRHLILPSFHLGAAVDAEVDGQPNPTATGDDLAGTDDEDGVTFATPLYRGKTATCHIVASAAGKLDGWIDFDGDGDWADAGEQIFAATPLVAGANTLTFPVPAAAALGSTYARFRFSRIGGLSFLGPNVGPAPEGEVEDYRVDVLDAEDFGDAPAPYPTLLANNGARHAAVPSLRLGSAIDEESDGQPNSTATGDDLASMPDDEDGVLFLTPLLAEQTASIQVNASAAGKLDAWIDFNADGDWADAGEQIFNNHALAAGDNSLNVAVPTGAASGNTFARFRFSSAGALPVSGPAVDGEVEDYQVTIGTAADLSVSILATPAPVGIGNNLLYTITVNNAGPSAAAGVTVTDILPGGLSFVSASASQGACTLDADPLGSGSFAAAVSFSAGTLPTAVALEDLDGDTKPELIAVNGQSHTVSVWHNLSVSGAITANSFAPRVDFSAGTTPRTLAVADLDGDCRPDVVVGSTTQDELRVLRNTSSPGNIILAAPLVVATEDQPVGIALGDVDGDGKADILVANSSAQSISGFRNTSSLGQIGLAPKVDFAAGSGPTSVALGDLNADGKPDLAVALGSDQVALLRNLSSGPGALAFAAPFFYPVGANPNAVAIGDLDGDGKPDVATPNGGNAVTVLRNTSPPGSISFAAADFFATGINPFGLMAADLNGDGKPDLAVANYDDGTISLLRNNSAAGVIAFAPQITFAANPQPSHIAVADLDGDGRLDLAVPNFLSARVSVLRSETANPTVTCNFGDLPAGASATLTIQVQPNVTGVVNNQASVASAAADPNAANNSAAASTKVAVQPKIISISINISANAVMISFCSQVGCTYVVEYKNSLSDPTWTLLQAVAATGPVTTVADPTGLQIMRFYRVRLQ